jgi:hypothetical protein
MRLAPAAARPDLSIVVPVYRSEACLEALKLDRKTVRAYAERYSWRVCAEEFVRNYYRYADQIFQCNQTQTPHAELNNLGFDFEIYASSEYSRMLEREWDR